MTQRRLLFVFSSDFGEVVNINLFVANQPFDVHYAYPERLFPYHDNSNVQAERYGNADELITVIDRVQPDVVFLCSGYLFSINGLVAPNDIASLLKFIHQAGISLVTTDPWMSFWRLYPHEQFRLLARRSADDIERMSRQLRSLQEYLEELFRNVPHLYAVPFRTDVVPSYSFFNADVIRAEDGGGSVPPETDQNWLFVLSEEDLKVQLLEHGSRFLSALTDRLLEILAMPGNRVTLVAPPMLAEILDAIPARDRVTLISFCGFQAFEMLVREAAVLFYWNILSSSLLYALYHGKTPLFFSIGHQAKLNDRLFGHVRKYAYPGTEPAMVSIFDPLPANSRELSDRNRLETRYKELLDIYAAGLPPAAIVEQLSVSR